LSKNQMSVGPITAPVSMIIGLLPMFSAMNSELEKIAKGIYSYYVRQMFVTRELENSVNSWLILLINFLVLSLVFAIFYRIKGLNNE
jgi:ABC-2 type transport system permease protein